MNSSDESMDEEEVLRDFVIETELIIQTETLLIICNKIHYKEYNNLML